jgi:hypothetical protein
VLSQLAARHSAVTLLGNNTAEWQTRQQEVHADLKEVFAPLPPPRSKRMPIPRSINRGEERLVLQDDEKENGETQISVRKVLVETRPAYWVSAGLWMPAIERSVGYNGTATNSVPAILFPSGHSRLAWREQSAQLIAINLAKRGFAVLGFDPIGQGERRMLPDLDGPGGIVANGTEHFSPAFEHEYVQRQTTLLGINAASTWLWDMTVLVDFLAAVPEVDAERMGVAGCSGGGTQVYVFLASFVCHCFAHCAVYSVFYRQRT